MFWAVHPIRSYVIGGKSMSKKLVKNARKRGQTSVEYILIIGVIVGVIMVFGNVFKTKIKGITEDLFSNIDNNIKQATGG